VEPSGNSLTSMVLYLACLSFRCVCVCLDRFALVDVLEVVADEKFD
jgi:hypothetical protein